MKVEEVVGGVGFVKEGDDAGVGEGSWGVGHIVQGSLGSTE